MRLFWLLLVLFCSQVSAAPVAVPALRQQVTDLSGTLGQAHISELTRQVQQLAPAQVAILVVPTTGEETIEQYATRVFDKWKLGDKTRDDGVLLLVAWQDRSVRIEVGYGLEGAMTDAQSGRIIRTAMLPAFRENKLAQGLQQGVTQIGKLLAQRQHDQESLTPDAQTQAASSSPGGLRSEPMFQYGTGLLVFLPFFLFRRNHVVLRFLKRVVAIAVICGVWLLVFPAEIVSNSAIFFFIITTLALLYWRLRKISRGHHSSDGSSSYDSDSGSSSSSSDSFSGGGGSSGGGGASDRW